MEGVNYHLRRNRAFEGAIEDRIYAKDKSMKRVSCLREF